MQDHPYGQCQSFLIFCKYVVHMALLGQGRVKPEVKIPLQFNPSPLSKYQIATSQIVLRSADKYVFDSVPLWCRRYVRHQSTQVPPAREVLGHICCATSVYSENSESEKL